MGVEITKGYRAIIRSPGWGDKVLFAETLECLDDEVEAYLSRMVEAKERRSAALLARLAGTQRAAYKAAREALHD